MCPSACRSRAGETSVTSRMFQHLSAETVASMDIRISLENSHPPEGEAQLDGAVAIAFVGWLDLIRVLETIAAGDCRDGAG